MHFQYFDARIKTLGFSNVIASKGLRFPAESLMIKIKPVITGHIEHRNRQKSNSKSFFQILHSQHFDARITIGVKILLYSTSVKLSIEVFVRNINNQPVVLEKFVFIYRVKSILKQLLEDRH